MSIANLVPILIVLGLVWLWLNGARARELAVELSRELCSRRGFQLLDESVSLQRVAPRRTERGIQLRRMFRFEYSEEGVGRRHGYILLLGQDVEAVHFADAGLRDQDRDDDDQDDPPGGGSGDDARKVIPFRRPH